MFNDPAVLFHNNVMEAYRQYAAVRDVKAQDGDLSGRDQHTRTAIELAAALFHFREHLPPAEARSRARVTAECPTYRLIADVTNAAKHRELSRQTADGSPLVQSAEDITEQTVITEYCDEEGIYKDAQTMVFVKCTDGTERVLEEIIVETLNYFGGVIAKNGSIKFINLPSFDVRNRRYVDREAAEPMNLEMTQDIAWYKMMRFMKFIPEKMSSDPVDLTGAKMKMIFKKVEYDVCLTLNAKDGRQITCNLELTDEETAKFHRLKTDQEREAFSRMLIAEHKAEIQGQISRALAEQNVARSAELSADQAGQ